MVSKENGKVFNSLKAMNMKIDKVFDAIVAIAIWEKDIPKNTFVAAVQAITDLNDGD